jgi:hypothetical protein
MLPVAGLASGVDVSSLDDTALEALLDAVLAERLARREFASFLLEQGEYRIGVDVPAGAFRVVHEGLSYITDITVYDSPGDSYGSFYGQVARQGEGFSVSDEIGRLVLSDGGVLKVTSGSARFFADAGGVRFE